MGCGVSCVLLCISVVEEEMKINIMIKDWRPSYRRSKHGVYRPVLRKGRKVMCDFGDEFLYEKRDQALDIAKQIQQEGFINVI